MAKGPDAFRTISEAADEIGVPQHVLRFWETRFSFIRPMKRAGGRRFYRPQDVEVLRAIKTLLHDQGFAIKGVQDLHRAEGVKRMLSAAAGEAPAKQPVAAVKPQKDPATPRRQRLLDALERLLAAKQRLDALLHA